MNPAFAEQLHPNGWYPIHAAALSGSYEIAKIIIGQPGVDVSCPAKLRANGLNDEDFIALQCAELSRRTFSIAAFAGSPTPLHLACMIGHLGIIGLLLENGASPEVRDGQNRDPRAYFDIKSGESNILNEYNSLQDAWEDRLYAPQTSAERVRKACQMVRDRKYVRLDRYVLWMIKPGLSRAQSTT